MYITNSINDMNEDYNNSTVTTNNNNNNNNNNQLDLKIISKKSISMCFGCGTQINDQYILRVAPDLEWHAKCLKCFECGSYLDENCTCFFRNGKTYCKSDYVRLFSKKCFKCKLGFNKNDMVMRAGNNWIYHINCFRCFSCNRQLSPGDEFALKEDGLLCKFDNEIFEKNQQTSINNNNINNQQNTLPLNTNINLSNSSTVNINNNNNLNSSILQTSSCQNIINLQPANAYTNLQNSKPMLKCDDENNHLNDFEENQNCLDTNGFNSSYNNGPRMMQPLQQQLQQSPQQQQQQQQPFGMNGPVQSISNKNGNGSTGSTSASSSSSGSSSSGRSNVMHGGGGGGHHRKDKTTRVRTVLNEKQLHTLRTCYGANPRPDALMKEQLVEMTGLSPRVIRVWFQNKRCKDKKKTILIKQMQEQQKNRPTIGHGIPMVATSPIRNDISNLGPGSQVEIQSTATAYQSSSMSWKSMNDYGMNSLNDMNNSMGHSISSPNSRPMGQPGGTYDQMMGFGSDEEDCIDQFSDNGDDSVSSVGFDETRIQQL